MFASTFDEGEEVGDEGVGEEGCWVGGNSEGQETSGGGDNA